MPLLPLLFALKRFNKGTFTGHSQDKTLFCGFGDGGLTVLTAAVFGRDAGTSAVFGLEGVTGRVDVLGWERTGRWSLG